MRPPLARILASLGLRPAAWTTTSTSPGPGGSGSGQSSRTSMTSAGPCRGTTAARTAPAWRDSSWLRRPRSEWGAYFRERRTPLISEEPLKGHGQGGRPVGLPEPIHQDADSCVLGGPPCDGEAVEHRVKAEPLGRRIRSLQRVDGPAGRVAQPAGQDEDEYGYTSSMEELVEHGQKRPAQADVESRVEGPGGTGPCAAEDDTNNRGDPDHQQQPPVGRGGKAENGHGRVATGYEQVDVGVIDSSENVVYHRPPGTSVIDGAGGEQKQAGDGVDDHAVPGPACRRQTGQHDAAGGNQRGDARMQPSA